MFRHMDRFFPLLLELLSDPADEVLMLVIFSVFNNIKNRISSQKRTLC